MFETTNQYGYVSKPWYPGEHQNSWYICMFTPLKKGSVHPQTWHLPQLHYQYVFDIWACLEMGHTMVYPQKLLFSREIQIMISYQIWG